MVGTEERQVTVRVIAELPGDPTGDLTIGLQRGADVVNPVRVAEHPELVVEPAFRVQRMADGNPNFLGPFAHGPRTARFVYLVWRRAGAPLGRTKIPLASLGWDDVVRATPPELRVRLIDDRGGPRFASVRVS